MRLTDLQPYGGRIRHAMVQAFTNGASAEADNAEVEVEEPDVAEQVGFGTALAQLITPHACSSHVAGTPTFKLTRAAGVQANDFHWWL